MLQPCSHGEYNVTLILYYTLLANTEMLKMFIFATAIWSSFLRSLCFLTERWLGWAGRISDCLAQMDKKVERVQKSVDGLEDCTIETILTII